MNPKFRLLKYNHVGYIDNSIFYAHELAGHFDVSRLNPDLDKYSIHTEYSAGKREFNSPFIQKYDSITSNYYSIYSPYDKQFIKVPKLWVDEIWTVQFADFVLELADSAKKAPSYIEIHPPFKEYIDIDTFLRYYKLFSKAIHAVYPNVQILLENRNGTMVKNEQKSTMKFLISDCDDLTILSNKIDEQNIDLKIALDIPQIQSAHKLPNNHIIKVLGLCKSFVHNVFSVHLWGRENNKAHIGNFDSYFESAFEKREFLLQFADAFCDDLIRLMVLEINFSQPKENTEKMIEDLKSVVQFVK